MRGTRLGDKLNVKRISGKPGGENHQLYLDCVNYPFKWQGQIVYVTETATPLDDHFPAARKFYVNEEGYWYVYYLGHSTIPNYIEYPEYTEE